MHETVAWDEAEDLGRVKTARLGIFSVGRHLFGEPSHKVETVLNKIDDPDRLDRMLVKIATLQSWKELMAIK